MTTSFFEEKALSFSKLPSVGGINNSMLISIDASKNRISFWLIFVCNSKLLCPITKLLEFIGEIITFEIVEVSETLQILLQALIDLCNLNFCKELENLALRKASSRKRQNVDVLAFEESFAAPWVRENQENSWKRASINTVIYVNNDHPLKTK